MTPPKNPAGECIEETQLPPERRAELFAVIAAAPGHLKAAVLELTDAQLDMKYVNWKIRQIVHHLADSHIHSYARFKWALTELNPTIKPYDESLFAALPDSLSGDISQPLALFEGLHGRWLQLMQTMSDSQFRRTFYHPESKKTVTLDAALSSYAWHCRHHTAQILWVREQFTF